jgi:alkanesulfonate monooxygenase SsuD/methylene tetrahydromethanopterin reductase-like flavin-dependent oxidoreductase (luciferase family)
MVDLSIQIEGVTGLTWQRWKRLVSEVESLGFAGLYCCDHFSFRFTLGMPSLEMILALTHAADHSQRLRFGSLVAPLSIRDRVMLARQAMALDDLSGGRMVLGIGAGWVEDEHVRFGYNFGDTKSRMDRLAEGAEVIFRLCRDAQPVSFGGRFYRLREAQLALRSPKPGGPTLMIAGQGLPRVLGLVTRFADVWTSSRLSVDAFRTRSQQLDVLLERNGRARTSVRRGSMDLVVCWRDEAELGRRLSRFTQLMPARFANLPPFELREGVRSLFGHMIDGSPEEVVEQIRAYAAAGLDELMIDWFDCDDLEGLEVLATQVLPRLA